MRSLYISQNGMLENLGQSQVLPYLRGLVRRGIAVDLLSFELSDAQEEAIRELGTSLKRDGIQWTPIRRRRDPRLRVKVAEAAAGVLRGLACSARRSPDIVHGRSYFPTAIGHVIATLFPRARLLFDCRGMIGDEYVDAGHWTRDRIEYRLVKAYEGRAFHRADGVVVLTDALRRWLHEKGLLPRSTPVEVIPCCVDLDRFRFDAEARESLRRGFGFSDHLVIAYSGSLGTWYCEEEVARFAGIVRQRAKRPVGFLLLTPSDPSLLCRLLEANGFGSDQIAIRRVSPAAMSAHLSAADIGISFIKSCFSKKGSSPTKVAEYLACGLAVALNGDIGDQRDLASEEDACVVLDGFSDPDLIHAADCAIALSTLPRPVRVERSRRVAVGRFSVQEVGVARYERLYRAMVSGRQ